jgi:translation initiation factor IF-1
MSSPVNRDLATILATITEELPQRLYRLQTDAGTHVVAGPSPELKRLGTALRKGQRVHVRPAALDPTRGTIVGLKSNSTGPEP